MWISKWKFRSKLAGDRSVGFPEAAFNALVTRHAMANSFDT
jgi:hypothetical protein